jgi:alkanesulfonate monooxygenase SsuD/methylene tetrahydromethanopterin reductase-like flavin-dependent oxidoreductase (luciferase family)
MRFCYAQSMTDPSSCAPLARAAEAAGFDSMMVPDSICYPEHADSQYPFNPDGSREFLEDKPFLGFRWPYHVGPDLEPLADKITKLRRFADAVIAQVAAGD